MVKTLQKLAVPEEKDCLFTKPDFRHWPSVLRKNKDSLGVVNNRNASQAELIKIAAEYTRRLGLPVPQSNGNSDLIVTGHQPNWHHCGIFAKNIIAGRFARQTGGTAIQLVLDHDICRTSMSLPQADKDGSFRLKTILLEAKRQDIPLELRPAVSREQVTKFIDSILQNSNDSLCSEIWGGNLSAIIENTKQCKSIADMMTQLQAQLNTALGLEMLYLPVSLMSQSDSFCEFACSVISNAARFTRIYNKAIKNKQQAQESNQTLRPLKIDYINHILELPFWLVILTGKRTSLYAGLRDKNVKLGTADSVLGTLDSSCDAKQQLMDILKTNNCLIRPKAVTLTLFARLYLADLFIHGTGAANYEYITDRLIRDYYKIRNVKFGVATATMTLPIDDNNREFFFGLFPKDKLDKLTAVKEAKNEGRLNCCSASR